MATGDVNTIATKGMVSKESSRMESRPQQQNQDKQRSWKTKKRWEDEFNDSSSQRKLKQRKAATLRAVTLGFGKQKEQDKLNKNKNKFTAASKKK